MAQNGGTTRAIVGSGWSFPLRCPSPSGGLELSSHEQDIEEAIYLILMTSKGERRMRPEFGCGIHDLVFAPSNATTFGLIVSNVQEALGWWEPRIDVEQVVVTPDDDDPTLLRIEVTYRIRATNDVRNLVYPFYRIPGEG
jgi:uncharacterized protein